MRLAFLAAVVSLGLGHLPGNLAGVCAAQAPPTLGVMPAQIVLTGAQARQQLLVTRSDAGLLRDVTRTATFRAGTPALLSVDAAGRVTGLANGMGTVVVAEGGLEVSVPVRVERADEELPVSFELDVVPILTRLGCNAGACHGKSRGQNGFQLSLLGFYPDLDYAALTKEGRGRRVFPLAPEESLLLRKAAGLAPHGGGKRMEAGGASYEVLRRWIAQGLSRSRPTDPVLQRVEVFPRERSLLNGEEQPLLVTAYYSDGTTRDVTEMSAFQSNESVVVSVDERGRMKAGPLPGEAAIMTRFMGHIDTCIVMIPLPGEVPAELYAGLPRSNFIDGLVWDKLQRLHITPSVAASDSTFQRRVTLDILGRVPTPEECQTFLADTAPDKRTRLIDRLLEQPEYANHWATKWADLLRPNPYRVGVKAVFNFDAWIRDAFRRNLPYDQFVRQVVTAQGSTWHNGSATLFRDRREPDELTTIISQLFLGIRLECAKCHHHPFESYGQEDFYGFAAYFARVGRKGIGISPPISAGEEIVFSRDSGTVAHPLTGEVLSPKPLFGTAPEIAPEADPRVALAQWMTSPENPYFTRVIVNRVWADIMGRGLVEPVDDLRGTNPPTNGPLLDALAQDFQAKGYDLKQLIRTITSSYVYGLSSVPSERNVTDMRNYSRHYRQRLRAETLLDAVCGITQVPETFGGVPPGARSNEIWTNRVGSLFLDSFGRPDANQDPPCERTGDTSIVQTLHLMNSPELHRKVTAETGRVTQLAAADRPVAEVIRELYLLVYARLPTDDEMTVATELFNEPGVSRRQSVEDLLWALLNTPEFVFKD